MSRSLSLIMPVRVMNNRIERQNCLDIFFNMVKMHGFS